MKRFLIAFLMTGAFCTAALAAPLGTDTRTVLPAQIQQVISVDYRALRNSPSGMALKNRVLPENLKAFETSLRGMGINPDTDVEQFTFVSYRQPKGVVRSFGVASGQFELKKLMTRFKTKKVKGEKYRDNSLWPAGGGFTMTFLDDETMLFGESAAVKDGLDVRDGQQQSVATMPDMMEMIAAPSRSRSGACSIRRARRTCCARCWARPRRWPTMTPSRSACWVRVTASTCSMGWISA